MDVVLPDLRFIEEERKSLAGILITHAHEDHIGAVAEMWPRFALPFTRPNLRRISCGASCRNTPIAMKYQS